MLPIPASVTLQGREVPILVLEEFGELEPPGRMSLQRLLVDPEELDRRCRAALLDPTRTLGHGDTRLDVQHHLDLMGRSADPPPPLTLGGVEAFVRAMTVRSIWISAGGDEEFLHVDYTIDAKATQYVLSVPLGHDGVIRSVRMES